MVKEKKLLLLLHINYLESRQCGTAEKCNHQCLGHLHSISGCLRFILIIHSLLVSCCRAHEAEDKIPVIWVTPFNMGNLDWVPPSLLPKEIKREIKPSPALLASQMGSGECPSSSTSNPAHCQCTCKKDVEHVQFVVSLLTTRPIWRNYSFLPSSGPILAIAA